MNKAKYTLSTETQAMVACLETLNQHWEQVRTALSIAYPCQSVDSMMADQYSPAFDQLKNVVQGFMLQSIDNNLLWDGKNEI